MRLGDLTDQAFAAVSGSLPASRMHREIDGDVDVSTAPSRFVAIVVNLLENAAKYGGSARRRAARRACTVAPSWSRSATAGPALRGESRRRLFEPFVRGDAVDDVPGQGVGLYLVRMLARSLGGTATLEERRGGGVLARVTLPQRRSDDAERTSDACESCNRSPER